MKNNNQRDNQWASIPLVGFPKHGQTIGVYGLFIVRIPTGLRTISASLFPSKARKFLSTFFADHYYFSPPKSRIFMRMFSPTKKFKIFNSIIIPNMVYMMYRFILREFSSKIFFHNISMFKKPFTMNRNKNISIFSPTAIFSPSGVIFPIVSFYSFLVNRIVSRHTTARTISCHILSMGKNLKLLFTKFTDYFIPNFSHTGYCTLNSNVFQFI